MTHKMIVIGSHGVTITEGTPIMCLARYNEHKARHRAGTLCIALYDNNGVCLLAHTDAIHLRNYDGTDPDVTWTTLCDAARDEIRGTD